MRKHLSFTIGVALSVVFIWLAFRNVHFAQLVQAYSRAHLWQVGVLVLAECFGLAVRGLRWYLLIAPGKKGTPWTVIKLETIGLALNNVLPFRLGELARATVGSSVLKTPIITLLATILVERILDMVLHRGKIAEMRTGEGKTLVATLPTYLNAISGKGAHIVTVNDYLARRDRNWMGPVFEFLGLSVGFIGHDMEAILILCTVGILVASFIMGIFHSLFTKTPIFQNLFTVRSNKMVNCTLTVSQQSVNI